MQQRIRSDNGRAIDAAAERSLFVTIVMQRRTVYVDVVQSVPGRIPCNRSVKRVPGGVVCTGILVSEGDQLIWSRISTV